ncbi:MAG: hypothetical protein IJD39_02900 [Clostridia bacterium]|nr:hypothetical protein [Clostridia bacterium]
MKKILSLVLLLSILATIPMSASAAHLSWENGATKYEPYPETVTITQGRTVEMTTVPTGDAHDNSGFTRYIEAATNIKLVNEWTAANGEIFNTRVGLALNEKNMPDVLNVNYQTFAELYEAGMIQDLTEAYNATELPTIKYVMESWGDTLTKAVSRDGSGIWAIPYPNTYQRDMYWIRRDWLEAVDMEIPTTYAELEAVMDAFVNKDPDGDGKNNTYGISMSSKVAGGYNAAHHMNLLFAYHGTGLRYWTYDEDGKAVYSSVQPETREVLAILRDWYQKGYIKKDFVAADANGDVTGGKVGIMCGPWWMATWPLNNGVANDKNADWWPFVIKNEEGIVPVNSQNPVNGYIVVSKDCENPEAVLKVIELGIEIWNMVDPDAFMPYMDGYFNEDLTQKVGNNLIPIMWLKQVPFLEDNDPLHELFKAFDENAGEAALEAMTPEVKGYYAGALKYWLNKDNPDAWGGNDWGNYVGWYVGRSLEFRETEWYDIPSIFHATTDTMVARWTTLQSMEEETMMKVIMGQQTLDDWDAFVDRWYSLGGETITEEVNASLGL